MPRPRKTLNQVSDLSEFYGSVANVSFENIRPGQHARQGFTQQDYDYFRPNEAISKETGKAIEACGEVYKRIGIIRNIIDLMAEFAGQGINIVHPNPRDQKTLRKWFSMVKGKDRSERFLNNFYKLGNVIIYRQTATVKRKVLNELKQAVGEPDIVPDEPVKFLAKEIPWRYVFLRPNQVMVANEELASFVGEKRYKLKVSDTLASTIKNAKTPEEKELIAKIPASILKGITGKEKEILLDNNKLRVFHYKKDDWETWALPMTYSVLADLRQLEKLGLVDLAACDGIISNIRLWTLGNLEHNIRPTREGFVKLAEVLKSNPGGGVIDLIWGPELSVSSTASEAYKFLGIEKYVPTLTKIYSGLGIPQGMSGGESKGGFTNNAISVKTLIERLNYGRDVLVEFWQKELEIVQKQLGIKVLAEVQFERMTLSDEAAEKALWIQMADRDLVSVETLQERFGESPEIERLRQEREYKMREKGKLPKKTSQWHDPQHKEGLEKIFVQNGAVAPSQVGFEYPDPKPEEKKLIKTNEPKPLATKSRGIPSQGRPKNSKDKTKRKAKRVVPVGASVNLMVWANKAYKQISDIVMPTILQKYGKTNARQLTSKEFDQAEEIKFRVLCTVEPQAAITAETVSNTLAHLPAQNKVYDIYRSLMDNLDAQASVEDSRYLMIHAYCLYQESTDGTNSSEL